MANVQITIFDPVLGIKLRTVIDALNTTFAAVYASTATMGVDWSSWGKWVILGLLAARLLISALTLSPVGSKPVDGPTDPSQGIPELPTPVQVPPVVETPAPPADPYAIIADVAANTPPPIPTPSEIDELGNLTVAP